MKPLFVHPNCEEWFLLWIQNYDFVASGVETSACRVLFLQRTLLWQSHFFFSQFFFFFGANRSHKFKSEYQGNKGALVLSVDKIHKDWNDAPFFAFYIVFFFFFTPPPLPSPLTPCWLQEFSDPGANWKCFCLSDLTQLIRNMPGYNNNYIQACS